MLNFENPPPDEEFENGKGASAQNGELFPPQDVEYPHTFHHAAESIENEAALPADEAVAENTPAPAVQRPATLKKVSLPHVESEAEDDTPRHSSSHKNSVAVIDDRKAAASKILASARAAAGLTQVEVEERTKVRAFYVEALENGNFDQLPQQVYVLAYLRRLAELYGITGNDLDALLDPWKDIPCEIPENLPASVYPDPDNPNRKTLKKLEIGLYTAGAIVFIGIVALAITLISSWLSGTRKAGNPPFDREVLLELQPKPALTAPAQPKAK